MLENDFGKVSDHRKLKRCHYRKQKQEESKVLNGLFQADPGSVYSTFNEMIKEEKDSTRPKYKAPQCITEGTERQRLMRRVRVLEITVATVKYEHKYH